MDIADVAGLVATAAAVLATAFAGSELRQSTRERREMRTAERDGVAVAWDATCRPNHPEQNGQAVWVYDIVVQNPGRLPVRDVRVTLLFGTEVRRLHYDGGLDEASSTLQVYTPVVLAGSTKTWRRSIALPFAEREELERASASVAFTPADGKRQTNYMDGRPSHVGSH